MILGSNTSSLTIQRHLRKTQDSISSSMERLSSGKRINAANDDAAGLSISNRLAAVINGYGQAIRNGGDAMSLIQVADGALEEVTSMLQRMRVLAVQASSGTYSDVDRSAINVEFTALINGIERTSIQTSYNGISVLNSENTKSFQLGPSSSDSISLSLEDMGTALLGGVSANKLGSIPLLSLTEGDPQNAIPASASFEFESAPQGPRYGGGGFTFTHGATTEYIGGRRVYITAGASAGDSLSISIGSTTFAHTFQSTVDRSTTITEYVAAWNDSSASSMYTAVDDGTNQIILHEVSDVDKFLSSSATYTGSTIAGYNPGGSETHIAGDVVSVTIGDVSYAHTFTNRPTAADATTAAAAFVDGWNADPIASAAYLAFRSSANYQRVQLLQKVPSSDPKFSSGSVTYEGIAIEGQNGPIAGDSSINGTSVGFEGDEITFELGGTSFTSSFIGSPSTGRAAVEAAEAWNADATVSALYVATYLGDKITFTEVTPTSGYLIGTAVTSSEPSIGETTVLTTTSATASLLTLDGAISDVDGYRATLGATSNRLEFAISNGMNSVMNHKAALSRIMDADFAVEMTKLAQAQVLQQAGLAMLAMANTSRGDVLALLTDSLYD